jgi:hypothetical protein
MGQYQHTLPTGRRRSTWYRLVHDFISTQIRLHKIHLQTSDRCVRFTEVYTLIHRMTLYEDTEAIWNYTHSRVALLLRTDIRYMPDSLLIFPNFPFAPSHNTMLFSGSLPIWYVPLSQVGKWHRFYTVWTLCAGTDGKLIGVENAQWHMETIWMYAQRSEKRQVCRHDSLQE